MEFDTSFPADREAFELVEQHEGLLDDVAELALALDVRGTLAGDHRLGAAVSQLTAHSLRAVRLVAQEALRPGRVLRLADYLVEGGLCEPGVL
ncbi:hypothetical protein [Streptomyces sp. NPDC127105]|uniref:hypothetical protein n=1 Tax=Streptomyces sp. NPDC127105 TaxID=3345359 RepID=UPI00364FA93C